MERLCIPQPFVATIVLGAGRQSEISLRHELDDLPSQNRVRVDQVPWCITLDGAPANSKGISRLRFWCKNSRVNGINDLPVFMHQGIVVPDLVL